MSLGSISLKSFVFSSPVLSSPLSSPVWEPIQRPTPYSTSQRPTIVDFIYEWGHGIFSALGLTMIFSMCVKLPWFFFKSRAYERGNERVADHLRQENSILALDVSCGLTKPLLETNKHNETCEFAAGHEHLDLRKISLQFQQPLSVLKMIILLCFNFDHVW